MMTVVLLVAVAAPALAGTAVASDGSLSVGVSQSDDGSATVEVTHNNTSADGAGVTVETVDDNATYDGTGDYTADNGTVALPAPNETVDVSVVATDENETASTTATLQASVTNETNETNESTFGSLVSSFVHDYKADNNTTQPLGLALADFVVSNNPGNAPAHAGPPENVTRGPPENVTQGPPENKTQGPPENATSQGPPEDDDRGPSEEKGNGSGNGGGPPDHAKGR